MQHKSLSKSPYQNIILLLIASTLLSSLYANEDSISKPLPFINININTDSLNFGNYKIGTVSFSDSTSNNYIHNDSVKVKYRGNSSAHYAKKNFSIKFPEKICPIDTNTCSKKWKLNAEYIDKTLMRNKLNYDLFRQFSKTNLAPQVIFTTVYINNNYNGIYALTESVDANFLKLNKQDSNSALYKDPPISNRPENHEKAYTDFVAFYKWYDFFKAFPEDSKPKLYREAYYNQRYPDIEKRDRKDLIYDITEFIFNSTDEDFTNKDIFDKYFDFENIIDWHLLLLLSNNQDGMGKNFYLFKPETDKPFYIVPWDYDHSFGRDGDGEPNKRSFIDTDRIALLKRLVETNAFNYKKRLSDRYYELKENNILTYNNIVRMIDENVSVLNSHVLQNEAKWPPEDIKYFKHSDFHKEVKKMKKWIGKRIPKIEKHLKKLQ